MAAPRKGGYRHLIYFIDGTWLWAGSQNTLDVYSNIYRINTLLNADATDGHAQIVHYSRGVGAIGGMRRYFDGGFSSGINVMIADLYVNLCCNYQPNDRIRIFGFSRGAVVARAFAGLIAKGICAYVSGSRGSAERSLIGGKTASRYAAIAVRGCVT